jgi:hypothetical protein
MAIGLKVWMLLGLWQLTNAAGFFLDPWLSNEAADCD